MSVTLDLLTFDPGLQATSPQSYAEAVLASIEQSWDSGADLVLLPEFTWMGLEPLLNLTEAATGLHRVAACFWQELWPSLHERLQRPGKSVVCGTVPFADPQTGLLYNRAPIWVNGHFGHQDKLHLTPWESAFTPGDCLRVWEWMGLRMAVIICLDIEIPELSVRLRDSAVDVILCPSATETDLGVERVDRCASARAVELGCYVGVSHLTGQAASELIDQNVGRLALYRPSQAAFRDEPRWVETEIYTEGCHRLREILTARPLEVMRRMRVETNPSLLGKDLAGMERLIRVESGI